MADEKSSRRALIVDDDPDLLRFMSCAVGMCKTCSYEILTASGAEEAKAAIKAARDCGNDISFLLTDIEMPNGHPVGLDVANYASEMGIPLIYAMSGNMDQFHEALVGKANRVFHKPIQIMEFIKTIEADTAEPPPKYSLPSDSGSPEQA
jgi:CheY-like chemotaxis protein